jgi:transcriptional regulator with XRE-family HTH domain
MSELGARLRQLRQREGLDQAAFGALGGVSRNTQSNYEKGERSPDVEYLLKLGDVGVDVQYLLTGSIQNGSLSASESVMVNDLRALPGDVANSIAAMIRTMRANQPQPASVLHDHRAEYKPSNPK